MNQTELDDLIAAHEAWLEDATRGRRLELTGVDLRGLRLAGRLRWAHLVDVDASAYHAAEIDLASSVLERVRFTRANLAGARLSDARLTDVDFSQAVLDDARLDFEEGDALCCDHARMRRISLVHTRLMGARCDGADLRGANRLRADFMFCSFVEASLREVNLTRASFDRVDLRGADLTNANARLSHTRLSQEAMHGVRGVPAVVADCYIETVDASPRGTGARCARGPGCRWSSGCSAQGLRCWSSGRRATRWTGWRWMCIAISVRAPRRAQRSRWAWRWR